VSDVVGEIAQVREHAGIGSDARAVFVHGDVAAVVEGIALKVPLGACPQLSQMMVVAK
jgi:hypothetical protein